MSGANPISLRQPSLVANTNANTNANTTANTTTHTLSSAHAHKRHNHTVSAQHTVSAHNLSPLEISLTLTNLLWCHSETLLWKPLAW